MQEAHKLHAKCIGCNMANVLQASVLSNRVDLKSEEEFNSTVLSSDIHVAAGFTGFKAKTVMSSRQISLFGARKAIRTELQFDITVLSFDLTCLKLRVSRRETSCAESIGVSVIAIASR